MRNVAYLALALAAGCAKTDSSDLLTSGIYAGITARATGDGSTTVGATLYVGNPINFNFVDLTGDDRLLAIDDVETKVMIEQQLLNVVSHTAVFPRDGEGHEFTVVFDRTIDDGAPNSVVALPAPFTIDPPATQTVSRAGSLTLSWSPSGTSDQMRWEVTGDCIELEQQTLTGDTGSLTIEANRIVKRMGDNIADTCPMTVNLIRTRPGTLDPGYGKGGTIVGEQARTITFTSTP